MEHEEFVERVRNESILWGVKGFYRPVFLARGTGGLVAVVVESIFALVPALAFIGYCVLRQEYVPPAWALPTTLAFLMGTPGLNCISGLPWGICAIVGFVLQIFFGPLHLIGGLLPGLTWFLSGAVRGTAMGALESKLLESPETYRKLQEEDVLILHRT